MSVLKEISLRKKKIRSINQSRKKKKMKWMMLKNKLKK